MAINIPLNDIVQTETQSQRYNDKKNFPVKGGTATNCAKNFFSPTRLEGRVLGIIIVASRRTDSPLEYSLEEIAERALSTEDVYMDYNFLTTEEKNAIKTLQEKSEELDEELTYKLWKNYQEENIRAYEYMRGCCQDVIGDMDKGGKLSDVMRFTDRNTVDQIKKVKDIKDLRRYKYESKDLKAFYSRAYHGTVFISDKDELMPYEENGKWGLKDKNGKTKLKIEYEKIVQADEKERGWHIRKDGKWGAATVYGNKIIPTEYEDIREVSPIEYPDGHLLKKDDKWGYIDIVGHKVLDFVYERLDYSRYDISTAEGFIATKDGKTGFIEIDGSILIPLVYDELIPCNNGILARVSNNRRYGFVNYMGEEVIPIQYDDAVIFEDDGTYKTKVLRNGNWEEIDIFGFPVKQ